MFQLTQQQVETPSCQQPAWELHLGDCTTSTDALDGEEAAFLTLINNYRAANGLGPLTVSNSLNRAAAWMVRDLGTNNYFSHTDSLGRSPSERAQDCGYPSGAGENLAAGTVWDSAQEALDAWQSSPGHNANMLQPSYLVIGIAREQISGSEYGWYWGTSFGNVDDSGAPPPPTTTPTAVPPTATSTPTQPPAPTATPTAIPTATSTPVPPNPSPTTTATPAGPPPPPPTAMPTAVPTATPTTVVPPPATPTPTSAPPTPTPTSPPPAASSTPTSVPAPPTPTPTPTDVPSSGGPDPVLDLGPGANLTTWPGDDTAPSAALNNANGPIVAVYGYDPVTERWHRFGPNLPGYVNALTMLRYGDPYWFITLGSVALPITK